jgi:hypothetical protein
LESALGFYTISVKFTAFKTDSEFQMVFRDLPRYVRFVFVEEADKIKTISNLKMLANGHIPMRSKGHNTTYRMDIFGKVFSTSNNYIYFGEDTGMLRRVNYLTYGSSFVPVTEPECPEKHVYHVDPSFTPEVINAWDGDMRSDFFNLVARYCPRVYQAGFVAPPPYCFRNALVYPSFRNFTSQGIIVCAGFKIPKVG